jgi:hypothetical protein
MKKRHTWIWSKQIRLVELVEWQTLMIALLRESVLAMKQTNTLMARLQNDIYPMQLWCDSVSKLVKFIPYLFCDIFTFGAKIISASA